MDQVAGLEDEARMEAQHVRDDLAVNVVAVAGVAIGGETEERGRRRGWRDGGPRRDRGPGSLRAGPRPRERAGR